MWAYVKLNIPPALKGISLAVVPLVPLVIILSSMMIGQVWNWEIHGCSNSDPNCYRSIFDAFVMESVLNFFD